MFTSTSTNSKEEHALNKLQILSRTSDGFALAEEDLKLRGPGEILGTAQSGAGELKFIEFLADVQLVREARKKAEMTLESDPSLTKNKALIPYLKKEDDSLNIS